MEKKSSIAVYPSSLSKIATNATASQSTSTGMEPARVPNVGPSRGCSVPAGSDGTAKAGPTLTMASRSRRFALAGSASGSRFPPVLTDRSCQQRVDREP
jgi:hypothetical protein